MPPTHDPRWASLWRLRPDVLYLNHGSFGACPAAVLEHQRRLQDALEAEPTDYLARELDGRLAEARAALGAFVGADPDDLAFVTNATSGVNAVLRSLDFGPGDELLTTDHAYGACRKAMEYVASRAGARVTVARVPFPVSGDDEIVDAVVRAVTPRTRLALVDHVTSVTALVFPIARVVRELEARGVDTLVDAAHAPGMVPMNLGAVGAAYTAANAHKWLCAPKGAAFLHVRRDRQHAVHPLTISHGYDLAARGANFRAEFDWAGTADPTPWLAISEAVRYLGALVPGGWPELMARNRALALRARDLLVASLGVAPPCPDSMIGSMASVPLPPLDPDSPAARLDHEGLMKWSRDRGVESWFSPWPCPGGKVVRASAQLYNGEPDYHRLAALLVEARRAA
jgi:isopenicillin-N epimerase